MECSFAVKTLLANAAQHRKRGESVVIARRVIWISLVFLTGFRSDAEDLVRAETVFRTSPPNQGSEPGPMAVTDDALYFSADDGIHGRELWCIDAQGRPRMVADFLPGPEGSDPRCLTPIDDGLYFLARWNLGVPEERELLWFTRGDPRDSQCLGPMDTTITMTPGSSNLVRVGEKIMLIVYQSGLGREPLFVERSPSRLVTQIPMDTIPGPWGGIVREQENYAVLGDRVVFAVQGQTNSQRELWIADADSNSVRTLVSQPDKRFGYPMNFAVVNNDIYMSASDEDHGVELWRVTGDAKSSMLVEDIRPGAGDSYPREFAGFDGHVFFQADDGVYGAELWCTDGTSSGTRMVRDINPGSPGSSPYAMVALEGALLFIATTEQFGTELWRTDGTENGTVLLADLNPGPTSSNPYAFAILDDRILFSANHRDFGEELWVSDGSPGGTQMMKDIAPGPAKSEPFNTTVFNGKAYFSANDGEHGAELWVSDGSEKGTHIVADLLPAERAVSSSNPGLLMLCGTSVFFVADDVVHGAELWVTDIATRVTHLTKDIAPGTAHADPDHLTAVGDAIYFTAKSGPSRTLWCSDLRGGDVKPLPLPDGFEFSSPTLVARGLDALVFSAISDSAEFHLLQLRPRSQEIRDLGRVDSELQQGQIATLTSFGGNVYAAVQDGPVWRFAKWDSSTQELQSLPFSFSEDPQWSMFQEVARTRIGTGSDHDRDLLCAYLALPGMKGRFVSTHNGAYFSAYTADSGSELWFTREGVSTAVLVKDCFPGPASGSPEWLTLFGDHVFFVAEHPRKGREIWVSDGTTDNSLCLNEWPGESPDGTAPAELLVWKDRLWFSQAGSAAHIRTLAVCQYQESAPNRIGNPIVFANAVSDPKYLTPAGDYLYFSAESPATGRELWRLRLDPLEIDLVANVVPEAGYESNTTAPIHTVSTIVPTN